MLILYWSIAILKVGIQVIKGTESTTALLKIPIHWHLLFNVKEGIIIWIPLLVFLVFMDYNYVCMTGDCCIRVY